MSAPVAKARVAVVVPARDAEKTLGACLDGLACQDLGEPFATIVVDNGSLDGTAAIAETHPLRPSVLRRPRGDGPGAARNDGWRAAEGAEVIAFTDADCAPAAGWLRSGLAADADVVQGRVAPPEGARRGPFDRTLWVSGPSPLFETANLFVRRSWLERLGGFREIVAHDGRPFGEDVDLGWRAVRAGARTAYADDALVEHAVLSGDWLAERRRDGLFCDLVREVPELRREFLFLGVFLSRRSAALVLALAGLRRPVLALPYLVLLAEHSRARVGVFSGRAALRIIAGDLVGLASTVRGTLRSRTPVL